MIDKKYIENYLNKKCKTQGLWETTYSIYIPLHMSWLDTADGKTKQSVYYYENRKPNTRKEEVVLWNKEHNIWIDKDDGCGNKVEADKRYGWSQRLGSFDYIVKRVFNDYKRGIISIDGHKTDGETFLPNMLTGAEYLKLIKEKKNSRLC